MERETSYLRRRNNITNKLERPRSTKLFQYRKLQREDFVPIFGLFDYCSRDPEEEINGWRFIRPYQQFSRATILSAFHFITLPLGVLIATKKSTESLLNRIYRNTSVIFRY